MAWIGAHFAIGTACGGAVAAAACAMGRRGTRRWKLVPLGMVAGGLWAVLPDMPHTIRQDLPGTILADLLGNRPLSLWLHEHGNWFFFHRWLDVRYDAPWQTLRLGLRGVVLMMLTYHVLVAALFRAYDRKTVEVTKLKKQLVAHRLTALEAEDVAEARATLTALAAELQQMKQFTDQTPAAEPPKRTRARPPVAAAKIDR